MSATHPWFWRARAVPPLVTLLVLLATLAFAGAARAEIVLAVSDAAHNGLIISDRAAPGPTFFAPATTNPTHAHVGGSRASMSQQGIRLIVSLTPGEGVYASTGTGPGIPLFGRISLQIQGTNGELPGTPVILRLESTLAGTTNTSLVQLFVNSTNYKPGQAYSIDGLTVGSSFQFWSGFAGPGKAYFTSILSVQPVTVERPPPPVFPSIDPSRVDCTAFRTGNAAQCYETAHEVFQLSSLLLSQLAANDWAAAEQDTLPTTPQLFPDGTVIRGIDPDVLPTMAAWAGSNNFAFVSIEDTCMYRPLDQDLVIVFGGLNFTIVDYEHGGTIRTIYDIQTEMFRRNPQMPRGWELVYEQIGYLTPLLGEQ